MKNSIIMFVSLMMVVAGLGCAALSHYITPADIDKKAVGYVVEAGVADGNDYGGYGNLVKATKLMKDVDVAHILNRQELDQAIEREDTDHSIHKQSTNINHQMGVQREEALFAEKGILSMGLTMAGFGGFTGLLGLMRKRPGDVEPAEVQRVVADATGQTVAELEAKNKQLFQVVKGVQIFMDSYADKDKDMILALKDSLDRVQDADTKKTVATLKVEV